MVEVEEKQASVNIITSTQNLKRITIINSGHGVDDSYYKDSFTYVHVSSERNKEMISLWQIFTSSGRRRGWSL